MRANGLPRANFKELWIGRAVFRIYPNEYEQHQRKGPRRNLKKVCKAGGQFSHEEIAAPQRHQQYRRDHSRNDRLHGYDISTKAGRVCRIQKLINMLNESQEDSPNLANGSMRQSSPVRKH